MNQVRKSFPDPYLTPGRPCTGSSYSGCSWHPAEVGPAPHTSSFNCPDLSRPLPPKQPPASLPKVPSNQCRRGNFLGTFLGNTSGNIHSSGRAAGCFYPGPGWGRTGNQNDGLPSHSKEKHSLGLQAWQTSEEKKSDIKTARGSISKTEQKIGFPHPPAALRPLILLKIKQEALAFVMPAFSGVPAEPASLWASSEFPCLPLLHHSAWISTAQVGQHGVRYLGKCFHRS